jgi:hypothetical protein
MSTSSASEARKWLRQRIAVPEKFLALVERCIAGETIPTVIRMSTDLYSQLVEAARRTAGLEVSYNLPGTLHVSVRDNEIKVIRDETLPAATMHATTKE